MYSICFTIAGLIFSIILFIIYNTKSNFKEVENKIYYGIITTTVISGLTELYSFILVQNNISINSSLYLFSLKLLFISFLVWIYLFTLYTLVITLKLNKKDYNNYQKETLLSVFIVTICTIIILILPINIKESNGLLLPSGLGTDILYILCILCFIAMIISIIAGRKELKNKKYYPMYFLIIILALVILIQRIFPSLLLINFSISILIYIMYFTIENPDIKVIKELNYTKELLERQNESVSSVINNLAIDIKNPLMEIANYNNKEITKKDIKEISSRTLSLIDQVNKIIDLTRIKNRDFKIEKKKYQTDNLINSIKNITTSKKIEATYTINNKLPKILYGDDSNLQQIISYLIDFIDKYFDNYSLDINISSMTVRSKCKIRFTINVDYKYTSINLKEKKGRYQIETKSIEYEIYEKLVSLGKGSYFVKKENNKIIFDFSLFQKICDINVPLEEEITYFNAHNKRVLVALNNYNDISKMVTLLRPYNVDIDTASSINELNELLNSNKTFDLIILSDTIDGIENYDIDNFKITIGKFSLIAGYKLQIVIASINNYKDESIDNITIPISKTNLDDIMVKYLKEN